MPTTAELHELEPWEREIIEEHIPAPVTEIHPVTAEPTDRTLAAELRRIDGNFVRIEAAITQLRAKPRRPHRTGSAARINADDIRFFWVILGLNALFAAAALAASFAGQYAMAPNTYLPPELYFLVPLFIDLPLLFTSSMVLIFRRRGQSTVLSWTIISVLTLLSSTINVTHVLSQAGVLTGAALTPEVIIGAAVMGIAPLLVLLGWEEITRLAVKPIPAAPETPPVPTKTTTRKRK